MYRMEIQAQYLMKCNLPIKQENLIGEALLEREDQAPQKEGNVGQAFVPGEARALSKMRAQ